MKRQASREYPVQKKFPPNVLNNTTVNTLGNTEQVIEVFPPEIFFKGKILFIQRTLQLVKSFEKRLL
jgi:hypothetical protein